MDIANHDISYDDKELFSQFGTFICKITKTKKLTFGAKEGYHDDRIMSLAIALKCRKERKYQNKNNNRFILTNAKQYR